MSAQSSDPSDFTVESLWQDLLGVVQRRKVFIAIVTVSLTAVVYFVLLNLKDKYEAEASLIVKLGTENADVPVMVEKGGLYRQGVMKEEINTYIALLQSSPLLEMAMDDLGLDRFAFKPTRPQSLLQWIKYPFKVVARFGKKQLNEALILVGLRKRLTEREQVLLALSRWLTVMHEKDSNVIRLSMRIIDPVLGKDYLEALIRNYLRMHSEHVLGNDNVLMALNEQAREDRTSLEQLRNQLMDYKREQSIASVDEQRMGLTTMMKALRQEIFDNQRTMAGHAATLAHLRDRRGTVDELVLSTVIRAKPRQQAILAKIAELEVQQADLEVRFQEGAPQLERTRQEIAGLEAALQRLNEQTDSEETFMRNPVVSQFDELAESIEIELEALQSRTTAAQSQLDAIQKDLAALDRADIEIRRLQLEIEAAESRFLSNAKNREQARSREVFRKEQVANVSVLVPPYYNAKPVYPRRILFMAGGIIGALGIAFGVALAMEWLSDRIYDVRLFRGLPKLVVLGEYTTRETRS